LWRRTNHEPINIIINEENGSRLVTLLEILRMTLLGKPLNGFRLGKEEVEGQDKPGGEA
jgi:hypothetical protein